MNRCRTDSVQACTGLYNHYSVLRRSLKRSDCAQSMSDTTSFSVRSFNLKMRKTGVANVDMRVSMPHVESSLGQGGTPRRYPERNVKSKRGRSQKGGTLR